MTTTFDTALGDEVCGDCRQGLSAGEPYTNPLEDMLDDTPMVGIRCWRCAAVRAAA